MIQEQITLHRIWFTYDQEAEQAASRFRQCEGCIDVSTNTDGVAVYTQRTVTQAMLRSLLEDSTYRLPPKYSRPCVIPSPDYMPGALVRLLWYFPGVASGSTVRILHLSYLGTEYRYQVRDEATKMVGWVDAAGVGPLEPVGEATDENGPRREDWCMGRYPPKGIDEDEHSTEDSVLRKRVQMNETEQ